MMTTKDYGSRLQDAAMGPKEVRSTTLSKEEEAACVAFRKYTLLPLDDCLYALQASIPHLTRSSLHRCFQRHGISRLPDVEGGKPKKQKFAYAELHPRTTRMIARDLLTNLSKVVPYKIHTILTDNGIQFAARAGTEGYWLIPFDRICEALGIEHRLTKINHPRTNGQVERMNRTIKEATVKRYHYGSHDELKQHLQTFLMAYNFTKRLKTLKGLTPYEYICKIWTTDPDRFNINPFQHTVGLNS